MTIPVGGPNNASKVAQLQTEAPAEAKQAKPSQTPKTPPAEEARNPGLPPPVKVASNQFSPSPLQSESVSATAPRAADPLEGTMRGVLKSLSMADANPERVAALSRAIDEAFA